MELLAFVAAIGALIWVFMNSSRVSELEDEQKFLRKEVARLGDRLANALVVPDTVVLKPAPQPKPAPPPPIVRPPMPVEVKPKEPQAPRPVPPPLPPPTPRAAPRPSFDWEALVGVKLFSWIAGVALVFAAIFFLKYSVEHGWLGPAMRVVIGLATGISLILFCEWKAARRYAVTANALDGAGIAILFATFYAAYALWNLIGALPTFGMMALVTVIAVLLSLHHDSVFVALLGLVGGFATPALLSTGEDRPIGLFSYLLLLNAGLAWVAYRKRWPHLTVLSAIFTTLYQWGWVLKFMQPGTAPLALTIFTVFPVLTRVALTFGEKETDADKQSAWFRHTTAISVALPLLFALYLGSMPSYGSRYWLLFGFLFLLDAGLALIAGKRGPEVLHLAGGMGTLATIWAWLQVSYTSAAWPSILAVVAFFVLFYLAAGFWIPFKDLGKRGVLAAPLLLVAFPVLASIEPSAAKPEGLFGALFVLMAAIAAYAIRRSDSAVHFLAAVFVLATSAVWSVKYLDAGSLRSGLSIYTVLGLFYLGVPLIKRSDSGISRISKGHSLALVGHAFLLFVVSQPSLGLPPWPFLLVLAVLNLGVGCAAFYARRGELHFAALAASQLLLIVWQFNAQSDSWQSVAVVSAVTVAAMGAAWFVVRRRLGMTVSEPSGVLLAGSWVTASLLGAVVLLVAPQLPGSPGVALLAGALTAMVCCGLLVDKIAEWRVIAPLSVVPAAFVVLVWSSRHFTVENWSHEFLFAAVIYGLYLVYPLLLGSTVKESIEPHLAAVLSSATFFLFARHSLLAGGFEGVIGVLPVAQAGLMGLLLWRLMKLEPPSARTMGRLALVAGAVLAFVTVAIPLQLEKEWITIGWALQAAALAWLSRKIPHRGLVICTSGLLAAVFVRLVVNTAVLTYHPRGEVPIFNWYLYTYLVAAAAFFVASRLFKGRDRILNFGPGVSALASSGGTVLLFLLLNIEIADYYSVGPNLAFNFNAGLAQDLSYTIGWGLFAFGLLIGGILLSSKVGRVAAIALLSVTVAKCFLHDLWQLGGLYRVGSFVGLAVCLTLVALLLQRFVLQTANREAVN